ncbi:MAG: beta-ketoacyl-ACP synthase II [Pseudomonadota bacterium]|nr:beta-ketoacyl-ACP synthase II [Pseudomonadota bacterium]
MKKVVVTGYGILSSLGLSAEQNWQSLKLSKSGVKSISEEAGFDHIASKVAGKVWDYVPTDHFKKKELRRYDPFMQYALLATREALRQAGIENNDSKINLDRAGVAVGSGIGGLNTIQDESKKLHQDGAGRISPFFIPSSLINMASGFISLETGFRGPNLSLVSACASGAHSIIFAAQQIEMGMCDVMICGGSEYATIALGSGGFSSMRALSTNYNDNPQAASRPWDRDRDGFVISDGAGILILESEENAKKRGAQIIAEFSGYGMNADAYHMIQPSSNGSGAKKCMEMAMQKAEVGPEKIAYINAHATSTPIGDQIEPIAIRAAFMEQADKLAVSSTKSMHGHMLGAAGASEAVITIMALENQAVPGTLNCDNPSEGCDLDFVVGGMRSQKLEYAMSNSFGFGGTNASLIFAKK